ncbi:hypothetical protein F5882DRAFT_313164, partial [Hyaloscypha sp. PMI_1271]
LKEDSREYFRDPNTIRYPLYKEKPVFRVLLAIYPDFDLLSLDIVSYRSTLSNLLRFYRGLNKDFRFNVDLIRDTIFLIRKESSPIALISNIYGYGYTFPEVYII